MRILIIMAVVLLCGCPGKIVYVSVPVPCTVPPVVSRPLWPIASLAGTESYGELVRAYGASLEAEKGYSTSLEILLDGYRKPK